MSRKAAVEALKGYLVARGGHAVERYTRVVGTNIMEEQQPGVHFGGRGGPTLVPDELYDLVTRHEEKATMIPATDEEMVKFLDGVIGVIVATREEQHFLWCRFAADSSGRAPGWPSYPWKQAGRGIAPTLGHFVGRPICATIYTPTVNGYKLAFFDVTSQLVDWELADRWLEAHMPATCRTEDGRLNRTDATNFPNIFPRD